MDSEKEAELVELKKLIADLNVAFDKAEQEMCSELSFDSFTESEAFDKMRSLK